jgi:hypothetical protein
MNAYQIERAYLKVHRTIVSCKTKEQLKAAEKMVDLLVKHVNKPTPIRIYLKSLIQNHSINCI